MWKRSTPAATRDKARRGQRSRFGGTMVETALIIGCWTIVFVGIFDVGIGTLRRNLTAHIARQAARLAIVRGSTSAPEFTPWGPQTQIFSLSDDSEIANTLRPIAGGIATSSFQLRLEWLDGNNDPDSRVRVTVSGVYESVLGAVVGHHSIPLQAKSTMSIVH